MNNKIILSICMIVKNEEKYIENCLRSMVPLIEKGIAELIIVDTGSEDKTVDICKKYSPQVYYKQWNNDFSEVRNYSISLARGEYIFIQDADQDIDPSSLNDFINLFKYKAYSNYNTIYVKLRNYLNDELNKYSELSFPLIFKNDGEFKYIGAVHNQPVFKEPIMHSDIIINHYGYIMDEEKRFTKFNRTATILKKELENDPSNYYYRFQLARSYNSIGDYINAMNQVDLYMETFLEKSKIIKENIKYYRTAAQTYYINNKFKKAVDICSMVLREFPYFLDCIYLNGLCLGEIGFYEKSNEELNKYFRILDTKLYLKYNEIEMFSVASKDNAKHVIEKNNRKIKFNAYISKVKDNLKYLMEINVKEAINIIEELRQLEQYDSIKDLEFFSISSAAYFIAGDYNKALDEVNHGLEIDNNYFDLIYNKACILEAKQANDEAIKYYELAKNVCYSNEILQGIDNKLAELRTL